MILNSIFKEPVVVKSDEIFDGCEFKSGTTAFEQGKFGLNISGDANVAVRNCKFNTKGYSAIYLNSTGNIEVSNCDFIIDGNKNPIEGNSAHNGTPLNRVLLKDLHLVGKCKNNLFNFYCVKDGAIIDMENIKIEGMSQESEVIRLSNTLNNHATFNVKGLDYKYDLSTEYSEDYTTTVLCQDYTHGQDFSKFTINFEDLVCEDAKAHAQDDLKVGHVLCVYEDGKGIIEDNNPVITMR